MSFPDQINSSFSILPVRLLTAWYGVASDQDKMKKTILTLIPMTMAVAVVPAGYDRWTAEQFAAHEEALHKGMKNGLASETLGTWGNHLLLKTRREGSNGQAELHETVADLIVVQSGRATIIIGGRILNGQTTAANEIRGT